MALVAENQCQLTDTVTPTWAIDIVLKRGHTGDSREGERFRHALGIYYTIGLKLHFQVKLYMSFGFGPKS